MEVLSQAITKSMESKAWKLVRLTRKGLTLSHMFFADNLLLFGEASFSQARVIISWGSFVVSLAKGLIAARAEFGSQPIHQFIFGTQFAHSSK